MPIDLCEGLFEHLFAFVYLFPPLLCAIGPAQVFKMLDVISKAFEFNFKRMQLLLIKAWMGPRVNNRG